MAKYLIVASYNTDGVKGLLHEGGTARKQVLQSALSKLGGSLESIYFAFGKDDVYATVELPDNVSAAAAALSISASGSVRARVVVLLTAEEIDRAGKQTIDYKGPGR